MKRLTKKQESTKDELVAKMNEAKQAVSDAFDEVAALMDEKLAPAIATYNDVVTEAGEFRDEVVGEMQSYYDERSEPWMNGDAGSAYQGWINDWENWDTSELSEVEQPSVPDMDHPDELEAIDNEVPS